MEPQDPIDAADELTRDAADEPAGADEPTPGPADETDAAVPTPVADGAAPTPANAAVDADLALLREAAAEFDGVEAALGRIDAGTYGVCTRCGAKLDDAVLAAAPLATVCPAHGG